MNEVSVSLWFPAITALIGTLVGAVASFIPALITEHFKAKREATVLRASLVSEVQGLMEIAVARQYLAELRTICTHLASQPPGTTMRFEVMVPNHYSRIYQANCQHIGKIDHQTAVQIVLFHQFADAVVQDIQPGGPLAAGAELTAFQEAAQILSRAMSVGEQLCSRT